MPIGVYEKERKTFYDKKNTGAKPEFYSQVNGPERGQGKQG